MVRERAARSRQRRDVPRIRRAARLFQGKAEVSTRASAPRWCVSEPRGADNAAMGPPRRSARVPPRGFEPLISTLKGWRPRPLDDGGEGGGRPFESIRRARAGTLADGRARPQTGVLISWKRMIAAAAQPAATIAAMPPRMSQGDRPAITPGEARPPDRAKAVHGQGPEHDAEHHGPRCQQRDRCVAVGQRICGVRKRPDQGDREHDRAGRDTPAGGAGTRVGGRTR